MSDINLTEAIGAGGDAANGMAGDWYCPRRHNTPRRACEFCVAEVAVTAAAPLIEAQVRAQIAADIEHRAHMTVGDRYIALIDAARIARGVPTDLDRCFGCGDTECAGQCAR